MAKYNLTMSNINRYFINDRYYTLQDEIKRTESIFSEDLNEFLYIYLYNKMMDYLKEDNPSKIIMINHYEGMINHKDYDDFCKRYCPNIGQNPIDKNFYDHFLCKNEFGDNYIYVNNNRMIGIIITEDFLNKYIDTKEEVKENS